MTCSLPNLLTLAFANTALGLITDCLTSRLQQVIIGSNFSSYLEILRGIPQGSILRPILFNLFINDLMFSIKETEICNFADDTTIYSCSLNYEEAHRKLSNDTSVVLNWFHVVADSGKFQIMFLGSLIKNTVESP